MLRKRKFRCIDHGRKGQVITFIISGATFDDRIGELSGNDHFFQAKGKVFRHEELQ